MEYKKLHQDYMNGKISKEKFLEEYRNPSNYQPQSRRTNRSHKYERKWNFLNSQNEYGQNLLQEAIEANKDKIAIDLVNKRIDINHQDDKGFSSLHYCAQFSNINIAELLLKNNANINIVDSYGNNPLWTAVFNTCEDYQMVRLFMKYGADAHHKNKANRSPIDFAQQIEDVDMVKILLG